MGHYKSTLRLSKRAALSLGLIFLVVGLQGQGGQRLGGRRRRIDRSVGGRFPAIGASDFSLECVERKVEVVWQSTCELANSRDCRNIKD